MYVKIMQSYPKKARIERSRENAYWASKETFLDSVGEFFNDIYLKLSGVKNGTDNYSDPSDVTIDKIPSGAVILFCIIYVLIKIPDKKKYSALHVVLAGISAGVCGNVADRLLHGYVIDFISIEIISFPIFNFADVFVTVFSVVLIFLFVFKYKENDLLFMDIKQKKYRELK